MKIGDHPFCYWCKDKEESTEHVLRSCPKATEVLADSYPLLRSTHLLDLPFNEWLEKGSKAQVFSSSLGMPWSSLFSYEN